MVICSREETAEFRQEQGPAEMQREAILVQIANWSIYGSELGAEHNKHTPWKG